MFIDSARPSIGMLVALHPEGVDRNKVSGYVPVCNSIVALHPEGVDRNSALRGAWGRSVRVALHPEGVDRNWAMNSKTYAKLRSPSTRRAWIEIITQ